ncbi:hypothetical protein Acr_02g0008730 [Actinidia rufa]|uniref:Uncharacterized protein n=1 Tax=Actinidia rufa TaxID=165716 RepID=A0A7J0E829_9ERIC|nr:hypothetical protein Acr_02g0008730 [Actinidia rufa]
MPITVHHALPRGKHMATRSRTDPPDTIQSVVVKIWVSNQQSMLLCLLGTGPRKLEGRPAQASRSKGPGRGRSKTPPVWRSDQCNDSRRSKLEIRVEIFRRDFREIQLRKCIPDSGGFWWRFQVFYLAQWRGGDSTLALGELMSTPMVALASSVEMTWRGPMDSFYLGQEECYHTTSLAHHYQLLNNLHRMRHEPDKSISDFLSLIPLPSLDQAISRHLFEETHLGTLKSHHSDKVLATSSSHNNPSIPGSDTTRSTPLEPGSVFCHYCHSLDRSLLHCPVQVCGHCCKTRPDSLAESTHAASPELPSMPDALMSWRERKNRHWNEERSTSIELM